MAINDHYEVKIYQTMYNQQLLNVYHYQQTSGSGAAPELLTAACLDATGIVHLASIWQSSQLSYGAVYAINMDDLADYSGSVSSEVGDEGGDAMPAFVCLDFMLVRTTRAVRNGHKRISGILESYVTNGVYNGYPATEVNAFAAALAAPLTDGFGNTWIPQICRKAHSMKDGGPATNQYFGIGTVTVRGITTQNTRKLYRGI